MKRDFELVRLLLIELEGEETVDLSSYTAEQVNYHKALVKEAGLAEGHVHYPSTHRTDIPDRAMLKRLTWEGHEFLDKRKMKRSGTKRRALSRERAFPYR